MSDPTNLPDLEQYLAELEAEYKALSIQIAGVRRRLGLENHGELQIGASVDVQVPHRAPPTPHVVRPDEFFRMSVPGAIVRYLEMSKKPQGPKDIADALQAGGLITTAKNFYTSVTTALKRLRDRGKLVNTGKGWGLAEWYSSRPAGPNGPSKKKRSRSRKKKAPSGKKQIRKKSAWQEFLAERQQAGKTMKEAAAEWKERQAPE